MFASEYVHSVNSRALIDIEARGTRGVRSNPLERHAAAPSFAIEIIALCMLNLASSCWLLVQMRAYKALSRTHLHEPLFR
jgi:hypothetical protein